MTSIHKYQGMNSMPEAHLTVNRNRVKQYGSKYYLKDGQEFELELVNNSLLRMLMKIYINEQPINQSGLVLQPDSRDFLERYIDENRKFRFDTFMVDDNRHTKEQRERNGNIRIEFYQEIIRGNPYYPPTPVWPYKSTWDDDYTGSPTWNISDDTNSYNINTLEYPQYRQSSRVSANYSQTETGRVGKGSHSNQSFGTTTGDFSSFPDYIIEFQILPESKKPVYMETIRTYCSECGYRVRNNSWKHCPQCGNRL